MYGTDLANTLVEEHRLKEGRALVAVLDQYCDEKKLPYDSKETKLYAAYIRSRVGVDE